MAPCLYFVAVDYKTKNAKNGKRTLTDTRQPITISEILKTYSTVTLRFLLVLQAYFQKKCCKFLNYGPATAIGYKKSKCGPHRVFSLTCLLNTFYQIKKNLFCYQLLNYNINNFSKETVTVSLGYTPQHCLIASATSRALATMHNSVVERAQCPFTI